ncbi:uncharacterized protein LOC144784149 [Lissotriton helveticus]
MGTSFSAKMQSSPSNVVVANSNDQPQLPLPCPPAEVDRLLSSAIAQALAPLQDSVNKLSAHVFKTDSGVFGDSGAGPSGVPCALPRTARKRDAGHLEGFNKLSEVFRKSARTLRSAPYRGDDSPGETGGFATQDLDPEEGFPNEGDDDEDDYVDEDEDASSEDFSDASRSWRPKPSAPSFSEGDLVPPDMFDPSTIFRPRSSEWFPEQSTADYVAAKLRQPLPQDVRLRLRSECPRPSLPFRVACTPEIDPKLCTFFAKYIKDPKKGIDRSWKACQDKLLDVVGPLTKIIELAQCSKESGVPLSVDDIAGWSQRAMCLLGNANCALSAERRRSLLLKIDPKLGELSSSEAGPIAQGALFGDPFVKELGKFVATFSALDKAQASMKKFFPKKVFGGAGRGRGRSSGRQFQQGPNRGQARRNNGWNDGRQGSFYPSRGGRGQGRGRGGNQSNSRGFNGKISHHFSGSNGRKISVVSPDLVVDNFRFLGSGNRSRVSHRVLRFSCSTLSSSPSNFFKRRAGTYRFGSSSLVAKRRNHSIFSSSKRFPQQYLFSGEERQRFQTGNKSPLLQRMADLQAFQDGGHPSFERPSIAKRLVGSLGSERCLPFDSNLSSSLSVPPVSVEESGLRISYAPLWSFLSALVFYQTPAPCGGTSLYNGDSPNNLPGRHSFNEPIQRSPSSSPSGYNFPSSITGFHHQCSEVGFRLSLDF